MSWFFQYLWPIPAPAENKMDQTTCVESNVDELFHSSVEVNNAKEKSALPDVNDENEFPSLSTSSTTVVVETVELNETQQQKDPLTTESQTSSTSANPTSTSSTSTHPAIPSIIVSRSSPIFYPPRLCSQCRKHKYRSNFSIDQWSRREEIRLCNPCKAKKLQKQ